MSGARCEIEMIDPSPEPCSGVLMPTSFKINGQTVYLPADAEISISAGAGRGVRLTVTLFPTAINIHGADLSTTKQYGSGRFTPAQMRDILDRWSDDAGEDIASDVVRSDVPGVPE